MKSRREGAGEKEKGGEKRKKECMEEGEEGRLGSGDKRLEIKM